LSHKLNPFPARLTGPFLCGFQPVMVPPATALKRATSRGPQPGLTRPTRPVRKAGQFRINGNCDA
jgi:hypothetical protein